MPTIIQDEDVAQSLIDARRAKGTDLWDEVWEGEYIVMPWPNDEHQDIADGLICVLRPYVHDGKLGIVRSTVNVSDRIVDWRENFRVPDIAVFRDGSAAENHDTFWHGGPDLVIEIVSPLDRSREKLDFYAAVGTREVLLVDREPWALELYRLNDGEMQLVGRTEVGDTRILQIEVLPLAWSLVSGEARPVIEIREPQSGTTWTV